MDKSDFSLTAEQRKRIEKVHVLIVEDNPVDRELLKVYLQDFGLVLIQEASNGGEAIFKHTNMAKVGTPFHLVLTDWKMPQKDGLSLLRSLRAEKLQIRQFIFMLTSVNDASRVKDALNAGVDDFVLKPIDSKILFKKVIGVLDKFEL